MLYPVGALHQWTGCGRYRPLASEQPVDEVVVSSGRWVKGHSEDDQSWHGAVLDENRENGRVSGTISGREPDKKTPATRHGLFRGPGPDQQAHQQTKIVPGDMDQIALVDILPAPQPRPAHPTPVQDVSEGALDEFRPVAHGLLADF